MARGRALTPAAPRVRAALGRAALGRAAWPAAAAAVSAVLLGPMLSWGFPLRYDLVSVPGPVLDGDALGLGDRLPRAVPLDATVALAARILPDAWLTQLMALAALTLAGWGASRLVGRSRVARAVALLVAVWNPFVGEQLAIGHVPHLLAYGCLPWIALAAFTLARPPVTGAAPPWAGLALAGAAASLTPGGGVLAVATGVAAVLAARATRPRPPRRGAGVGAVVLLGLLQAPWVVACLLHPSLTGLDENAADFRVRAETSLGPVLDVLGLGGMWNGQALPAGRSGAASLLVTVLLLVLAGLGAREVWWRRTPARTPAIVAAGVMAAGAYLVALLPVLPGVGAVFERLVGLVPGLLLLRDGHRWLAPAALVVAVLAGHGASALTRRLARRPDLARPVPALGATAAGLTAGVLVACAVVAAQISLAWGLGGRLTAAGYPPGWDGLPSALAASDDRDTVLVLPWQPFRQFPWAGAAPVLDPAPRMIDRPVVVSDALTVDGRRGSTEGRRARGVDAALTDGDLSAAEAARLGLGWVLVERGTPGDLPELPPDATPVLDGGDLLLLRLASPADVPPAGPWRTGAVVGAHLLTLLSLLVTVIMRVRRRSVS